MSRVEASPWTRIGHGSNSKAIPACRWAHRHAEWCERRENGRKRPRERQNVSQEGELPSELEIEPGWLQIHREVGPNAVVSDISNGGPEHCKSKICLWKRRKRRIDETGSNGVGERSSGWDRIKAVQLAGEDRQHSCRNPEAKYNIPKSSKLPIKCLRSPSINRGSSNRGGNFKSRNMGRVPKGENVYFGCHNAMWSIRSQNAD